MTEETNEIPRECFVRGWKGHQSTTNIYLRIPAALLETYTRDELFAKARHEYRKHERVNVYLEIDGVTYAREEAHAQRCMLVSPLTIFDNGGTWDDCYLPEDVLYKDDVTVTSDWGVFKEGMKFTTVEIDLEQGMVRGFRGDGVVDLIQFFAYLPQTSSGALTRSQAEAESAGEVE